MSLKNEKGSSDLITSAMLSHVICTLVNVAVTHNLEASHNLSHNIYLPHGYKRLRVSKSYVGLHTQSSLINQSKENAFNVRGPI